MTYVIITEVPPYDMDKDGYMLKYFYRNHFKALYDIVQTQTHVLAYLARFSLTNAYFAQKWHAVGAEMGNLISLHVKQVVAI